MPASVIDFPKNREPARPAPRIPASRGSLADLARQADQLWIASVDAQPLEATRTAAIDHIIAVFDGSDPARILRHVAQAAFMHGAWAGRIFSAVEISNLGEHDRAAALAPAMGKAVQP